MENFGVLRTKYKNATANAVARYVTRVTRYVCPRANENRLPRGTAARNDKSGNVIAKHGVLKQAVSFFAMTTGRRKSPTPTAKNIVL